MNLKKFYRSFNNSLFTRTLLMFSLMAAVTLLAMFFYVNHIVAANQVDKIREMNVSQLKRVQEDMDTRLEGIQESMSQLLYSKDSITLMINAEKKDPDNSQNIVKDLAGLSGENSLISQAVMYLPTTEEVYSSVGNFVPIDSYTDREVIDRYLEIRSETRSGNEDTVFTSMIYNGQLYLISDFAVPNFIGVLVIAVDMDRFDEIVQGMDGAENGRYFVYQKSSEDVLVSETLAANVLSWIQAGDYYFVDSEEGNQDSSCYLISSDIEDICYGCLLEDTGVGVSYATLFLSFLPFLIAYAIFAVLYSTYASRTLYRPIARLMRITVDRRAELDEILHDRSRDEMEYLEEAFRNTWGENRQNRELLASISHDMAEQLFRNVLMGKPMEDAYITNTLQGLGMETMGSGRYMAEAIFLEAPENREFASMEAGMYRRSVISFIQDYKSESGKLFGVFMDQNMLALAVCFPEGSTAADIQREIEKFSSALLNYTEQLPFTLLMASGRIYSDIRSLSVSYQEACSQVEYLIYMAEGMDQEDEEVPEMRKQDNEYDCRYFRELEEQLAEAAEKERREIAEESAEKLIDEIRKLTADGQAECLGELREILAEKMIDVHVPADEMKALTQSMERAEQSVLKEKKTEKIIRAVFDIVKAIHTNSRKSRYRYVDVARDYIAAHYADGNLTLNEVSEAVGISAPYLSGIFAESEEIGFSAYLSNYRVEQAKQFLEQTVMSVTDIGYKCGFNSAQSFSRVFKKNTGYTPGQYRDLMRSKES